MSEKITAEMLSEFVKEHSPEEIKALMKEHGFAPDEDVELSLDDLETVNGGKITEKGINGIYYWFSNAEYEGEYPIEKFIAFIRYAYRTNWTSITNYFDQMTEEEAVYTAMVIYNRNKK